MNLMNLKIDYILCFLICMDIFTILPKYRKYYTAYPDYKIYIENCYRKRYRNFLHQYENDENYSLIDCKDIRLNFYNDTIYKFNKLIHKQHKIYAKKIEIWFLECKYNPKYKYCRERLKREYDETFESTKAINT